MPRAMALLSRDDYALETLVNHVLPLQQIQDAFDLVHNGSASKVVIGN